MFQEEINKNQKGGNNNRDSGLFGLDVPPKPEVGNPMEKHRHCHNKNADNPSTDIGGAGVSESSDRSRGLEHRPRGKPDQVNKHSKTKTSTIL